MSMFLSNVIKLFSATLAGQILGIIVTPFLTRLYTPSDFGIFQLFFSIVNLIAIISCFSYHSAIQLPKKDEDAANIVVLCLALVGITTFFITIFFFILSSSIEKVLNAPGLSHYLLLFPIAIIANSMTFILISWLSRREEYGSIAQATIYSSISGKGVSLGSGIISPSPFGLILGTIVNDATIAVMLLRKTVSKLDLFQKVSYQNIKQLAIRYKKFPEYNAVANLAGTGAVQVTPFMLAIFFSPIIVGYYAVVHMIMILPSKLMGNSLSSVFFQKACAEKNLTGSIADVVKAVHTRLISIGMFSSLIIMIIGPELFAFCLGAKWFDAGVYAQILAPWFFVAFISTPLMSIFNVLEMQGANFWFNILLLITRVIVLIIAGLFGDPILGMILLSGTGVFFWSWMNMYSLKIAGVSVRRGIQEIIRYLFFGLFICIPLIIAKYYSVSPTMLIAVAIFVSLVYYMVIIHHDTELKTGIINSIQNILHK